MQPPNDPNAVISIFAPAPYYGNPGEEEALNNERQELAAFYRRLSHQLRRAVSNGSVLIDLMDVLCSDEDFRRSLRSNSSSSSDLGRFVDVSASTTRTHVSLFNRDATPGDAAVLRAAKRSSVTPLELVRRLNYRSKWHFLVADLVQLSRCAAEIVASLLSNGPSSSSSPSSSSFPCHVSLLNPCGVSADAAAFILPPPPQQQRVTVENLAEYRGVGCYKLSPGEASLGYVSLLTLLSRDSLGDEPQCSDRYEPAEFLELSLFSILEAQAKHADEILQSLALKRGSDPYAPLAPEFTTFVLAVPDDPSLREVVQLPAGDSLERHRPNATVVAAFPKTTALAVYMTMRRLHHECDEIWNAVRALRRLARNPQGSSFAGIASGVEKGQLNSKREPLLFRWLTEDFLIWNAMEVCDPTTSSAIERSRLEAEFAVARRLFRLGLFADALPHITTALSYDSERREFFEFGHQSLMLMRAVCLHRLKMHAFMSDDRIDVVNRVALADSAWAEAVQSEECCSSFDVATSLRLSALTDTLRAFGDGDNAQNIALCEYIVEQQRKYREKQQQQKPPVLRPILQPLSHCGQEEPRGWRNPAAFTTTNTAVALAGLVPVPCGCHRLRQGFNCVLCTAPQEHVPRRGPLTPSEAAFAEMLLPREGDTYHVDADLDEATRRRGYFVRFLGLSPEQVPPLYEPLLQQQQQQQKEAKDDAKHDEEAEETDEEDECEEDEEELEEEEEDEEDTEPQRAAAAAAAVVVVVPLASATRLHRYLASALAADETVSRGGASLPAVVFSEAERRRIAQAAAKKKQLELEARKRKEVQESKSKLKEQQRQAEQLRLEKERKEREEKAAAAAAHAEHVERIKARDRLVSLMNKVREREDRERGAIAADEKREFGSLVAQLQRARNSAASVASRSSGVASSKKKGSAATTANEEVTLQQRLEQQANDRAAVEASESKTRLAIETEQREFASTRLVEGFAVLHQRLQQFHRMFIAHREEQSQQPHQHQQQQQPVDRKQQLEQQKQQEQQRKADMKRAAAIAMTLAPTRRLPTVSVNVGGAGQGLNLSTSGSATTTVTPASAPGATSSPRSPSSLSSTPPQPHLGITVPFPFPHAHHHHLHLHHYPFSSYSPLPHHHHHHHHHLASPAPAAAAAAVPAPPPPPPPPPPNVLDIAGYYRDYYAAYYSALAQQQQQQQWQHQHAAHHHHHHHGYLAQHVLPAQHYQQQQQQQHQQQLPPAPDNKKPGKNAKKKMKQQQLQYQQLAQQNLSKNISGSVLSKQLQNATAMAAAAAASQQSVSGSGRRLPVVKNSTSAHDIAHQEREENDHNNYDDDEDEDDDDDDDDFVEFATRALMGSAATEQTHAQQQAPADENTMMRTANSQSSHRDPFASASAAAASSASSTLVDSAFSGGGFADLDSILASIRASQQHAEQQQHHQHPHQPTNSQHQVGGSGGASSSPQSQQVLLSEAAWNPMQGFSFDDDDG